MTTVPSDENSFWDSFLMFKAPDFATEGACGNRRRTVWTYKNAIPAMTTDCGPRG